MAGPREDGSSEIPTSPSIPPAPDPGNVQGIIDRLERLTTEKITRLEDKLTSFLQLQGSGTPPLFVQQPDEQSRENQSVIEAARAQDRRKFDPSDIYDTLIDPHVRTKKELCDFAESALDFYITGGQSGFYLLEMFGRDFRHWKTNHFSMIRKKTIVGIRNCLHTHDAIITMDSGIDPEEALSGFLYRLWKDLDQTLLFEHSTVMRKPEATMSGSSEASHADASVPGANRPGKSNAKPADVAKMFPRDRRYSGSSHEPLRRLYSSFKVACKLSGVEPENSEVVLLLLENVFLTGSALVYFTDQIKSVVASADDAVHMLEIHFLGKRAKRVNDEIWHELSFDFVKKQRASRQQSNTFIDVLNDLIDQIINLSDMRTSAGSDDVIIEKVLFSVRQESTFSVVCQNPPAELQPMIATLRSCALEADRRVISSKDSSDAFYYGGQSQRSGNRSGGFYVDRELHRSNDSQHIRGFGRGPRRSYSRNWNSRSGTKGDRSRKNWVPPDVCIVCHKKGCHSSKHKTRSDRIKSYVAQALLADHDADEESFSDSSGEKTNEDGSSEDDQGGQSNLAVAFHVHESRVLASMGLGTFQSPINGAVIDSGSSILSTIGERLVNGAKAVTAVQFNPRYDLEKTTIGGIGTSWKTQGQFKFGFIFGHLLYEMDVHILPGISPLLISHKDLDRMGLNYQTHFKTITRVSDGYTEDVTMKGGLPYLRFNHQSLFSEAQLRAMHRNLGHPSVEKQMRVIASAEIEDLPEDTRRKLEKLVQHCHPCQVKRSKPRRFLFSIRDSCTGEFNSVIQIDVMKLVDGNVLHVICTGTLFQSGIFVKDPSCAEAWRALRLAWINIYAGAPDLLVHDQASNFTGAEFKEAADEWGIVLKPIPTEAHERVGLLERRHAVVRAVYDKLRIDLPHLSPSDRLSYTFRAINDVPDADTGISPTTMVFGVYPKLPGSGPRGSMAERARIISECTKLAERMKARRVIRDSMRITKSPNQEEILALRRLPPGSFVLVYREKKKMWMKYKLVSVSENNVTVVLPGGKHSTFGIHCARVYRDHNRQDLPEQNAFISFRKSGEDYTDSRLEELKGLREIGTFEIVPNSEAQGHRLYSSVFVDKIKTDGAKKSRFCVAAFNDQEHRLFTAAPTVRRSSIRLLVSICAMYQIPLYTRDVTKAFVQSTTVLRRPVFVRAPKELGITSGVMKIIRPLYGMPESPMHWFSTYLSYHKDQLEMTPVPMDPCMLYQMRDGKPSGIVGMQVDDTLFGGDDAFLELENCSAGTFPSKGRMRIREKPVSFNGIDISATSSGYLLSQEKYLSDIVIPSKLSALSFDEFRSLRAKYAYAAYSTLPEILVHVAKLSQFTEDIYEKKISLAVKILKQLGQIAHPVRGNKGLSFIRVDPVSSEVLVCVDAAFATNMDHTSQLGVIVMLRDISTGDSNVIHFTSTKSKRIVRSVLAAELYALIEGFDVGFIIRDAVQRCTGMKSVPLTLATDSRSLFQLSVTLVQTTEKRLLIDLNVIREAYEKRDLNDLVWISGDSNPADGLTKMTKRNDVLGTMLATNQFNPQTQSWIKRDSTTGDKRMFDLPRTN